MRESTQPCSPQLRARAAIAGAALLTALIVAPPAGAQTYSGATAQRDKFTAEISNGMVISLSTRTGRLQTCSGQPDNNSYMAPVHVDYAGPAVPVVAGAFHVTGTTTGSSGDPFTFTVDGKLSRDGRAIDGSVTVSGDTQWAKACTGTWMFDAVVPPRSVRHPKTAMFVPRGEFSSVSFDYRRGAITHLRAHIAVHCDEGLNVATDIDSAAYGVDPIHTSKQGRFSFSGGVLDEDTGIVVHYIFTGRVKGTKASGRIRTWRTYTGREADAAVIKCTQSDTWHNRYVKPPVVSTAPPTAFYTVAPFRAFEAGRWNYYISVLTNGCTNASSVKATAPGGLNDLIPCNGEGTLGPLTPKRTYRVIVTPIGIGGKPAKPSPPSDVYVPGDDGVWKTVS